MPVGLRFGSSSGSSTMPQPRARPSVVALASSASLPTAESALAGSAPIGTSATARPAARLFAWGRKRIVDFPLPCLDIALVPRASPLEARARRMVAAMDLRVAVLACASDNARARDSARLLCRRRGLARVIDSARMADRRARGIERARMAERRAVALLANEWPRADEQGIVVRAVGRVAIEAALTYRGMLPEERATLLGVTHGARFVDAVGLEQRPRDRAVRIVAVGAAHLALGQRHVRAALKLRARLLVAERAGVGDERRPHQAVLRQPRHRTVAVATGDLVERVRRARPVDALAALVTAEALRVLAFDWRAPLAREADDGTFVERVRDVLRTRAVAGLAPLPPALGLWFEGEALSLPRVREMPVVVDVAGDALAVANVPGVLRERNFRLESGEQHCDDGRGAHVHGDLNSSDSSTIPVTTLVPELNRSAATPGRCPTRRSSRVSFFRDSRTT